MVAVQKKVLVIDDEESILDLLCEKLSKYKVTVVRAANGIEALFKLDNQKFDLIITDIKMPKKDGLTIIEKIRRGEVKVELNRVVPIVVISAFVDREKLKHLAMMKVAGILTKPFDMQRFTEIMDKFLVR